MIGKRLQAQFKMLTAATITVVLLASTCTDAEDGLGEPEISAVVVTQWNDSTELFLEYPHMVAGEHTGNWAIHLTDMDDFQPIRSGTLTVNFVRDQVRAETFQVDAPLRDGIFILDPVVMQPGVYRVEMELTSPQVNSRHTLAQVRVYSSVEEAPAGAAVEDEGGIAFLKEQQWVIPFAVHPLDEHEVQRTVMDPAEIVPPDGALVEVSALVDGIAPAEENRNAPSVGERVREGQILVILTPTAQGGGFAQSRGEVERLQREVERSERLFTAGAIAGKRLEESRHNLEIAQAELDAIGGVTGGVYQLSLRAPISGVVARRSFLPGARVEAGEPLFTIVDPATAWLRVQMSAATATKVANASGATFTTEDSEVVFHTSRLLSVGTVMNSQTRTVPVVFEVAEAGGLFAFGQLAQATVPIGGVVGGMAVPNEAILDDNGTPVAYVQTGGETFARRILTLGERDGIRTQVLAGLSLGEMVVTAGAYQVRLSSLSGGDFAGGHAH
jgi:cobalt-zinc-cadmium efflux system membrane fusion protein